MKVRGEIKEKEKESKAKKAGIYYAKYYDWGVNGRLWKKSKIKGWRKKLKWERKTEESKIKDGEKALKMHLFWVINSKNVQEVPLRPPLTYSSVEKWILKEGEGEWSKCTIYNPGKRDKMP